MADMGVIRFTIQGDAKPALQSIDRLRSRISSLNGETGRSSGFNRFGSVLQRAGRAADRSSKSFSKMTAALGRVAFYRVVRSAIKSLEDAFSEGLQNAYAFSAGLSNAIDGRIATALDGLTVSANTMKNQLGAAFGSLLAAIAPIINTLISLITSLATAITQLFAAFTGGTFLKAKNTSAKFADNMKKGAGSAKEWKNQLMGFDEINRLEDQSGGGGGGGASGINPNDLFEIAEVEGIFARIAAKWKELVDSLDFEPLLKAWDRLKAAVGDFVDVVMSGLAWVWDNILVPLAHWSIEKGLPSVINMLASAFEFLSAALKFLAPYAQWVWDHFLQPLAKWTGDLFIKAINTITDLFEKLTRLLNGETSFGEFLDSIDGVQLALLSLAAIFAVVKIAGGLFGTAMKLLSSPLLEIIVAVALVVAAFKKFKDAFDKIREAGKLTVDSFSDLLAGAGYLALAIGLFTNPWIAVGGAIALVVAEIIKHWDELVEWWHSTTLYQSISETWDGIKQSFSNAKTELADDWARLKESFTNKKNTAVEFVVNLKDTSAEWWANTQTWWSEKVGSVEDFVTNVRDDSSLWWSNVARWWEDKRNNALEFKVKITNTASEWWENVKGWWESISAGGLWTMLNIKIPTISAEWVPFTSLFGQTISYPRFSVSWNAKGGIVDGATLIGAGEAGKEAIIPLERNKEWIGKVAEDMVAQQNRLNGSNVGNDDSDEIINAILAVGTQIVTAIAENSPSGEVDWRRVAQNVTKYQNQMARAGA